MTDINKYSNGTTVINNYQSSSEEELKKNFIKMFPKLYNKSRG